MNAEKLFFETIGDLKNKIRVVPTEYSVLMASALLRKLVVDGNCLAHQVNRKKHKIRYSIVDDTSYRIMILQSKPQFWAVNDGIYPPNKLTGLPVKEVRENEFLRWPAMYWKGVTISVGELIRQAANVSGGVHLGEAKKEADRELAAILDEFGRMMQVGGIPGPTASLMGIGNVVIDAMDRLWGAIRPDSAGGDGFMDGGGSRP